MVGGLFGKGISGSGMITSMVVELDEYNGLTMKLYLS